MSRNADRSPWMTAADACRVLGISAPSLAKLVEQGRIGTLQPLGLARKKYSRPDVEALARQSTRPATVGAEMAAHG